MTTHAEYIEAIKKAAISTGTESLIKVAATKLPFLFWGPFGVVTQYILGKVVEVLIRETEYQIFFKYIDMRVDAQGKDFVEAALENYRIQTDGTAEEKKKSEEILISKFREFVILTN